MALIGKIDEFQEGKEEWPQYIERLNLYFIANEITSEAKKQATLLTVIGASSYKLLRNLVSPAKPADKKYEELVTAMNNHHCPVPSEIVQRCKFNSRFRMENESIADFMASLRSLAEFCNYGGTLDHMLRDRLVCGVRNDRIQRRLLAEKELTLSKAVDIASSIEMAANNVRDLQAAQATRENVHKIAPSQQHHFSKAKACFRCGNVGHTPDRCRFRDSTCHYCKKKGHIAPVCLSKKRGKQPQAVRAVVVDESASQDGDEVAESDGDCLTYHLHQLTGKSNVPPMKTSLVLDGREVEMEVDTGASISLISEKTFAAYWPGKQLSPTNIKLRTYTEEIMEVVGTFDVEVAHEEEIHILPLIVVKQDGPSLIGRNWLYKIKLDWQQINTVRPSDLKHVLEKHDAAFRDELGTLKGTTATIYVDKDATPRFCKARVVPYAMRKLVEEELDRLQQDGIIEPVQFSEWAAPIVPVMKADKKSVRICGDYKVTVNRAAKVDRYPIPKIEDLFASLAQGEKFTKLDMSQAYQQLVLDEESRKYVVINTHKGLFQYTRLPFGISSAPAIFQRVMEGLLQGIPHVSVYLDDILITGKNDVEHLATLEAVLSRFEEAGLRLKRSKCVFMAPSVEYLGHTIDAEGLHPTASKVKAIKNAPVPKTVTELRAYLGLLAYYGKFLPSVSTTLAPLYALLRKEAKWKWGSTEQTAFDKSKDLLISSQVLAHYDPQQEIIVACDASQYGIGAVLAHRYNDGSEKPIAFASRTLADAEKKYSQIEKEGLACVFAVSRFHAYLYGRRFTLVTDHKPLLGLFNEGKPVPAQASGRIQRWALTLAMYDYTLRFKPTEAHANADALSRLPLSFKPATVPMPAETVLLLETLDESPVSSVDIQTWTRRDPALSRVLHYVERGWPDMPESDPELKPYRNRRSELSVQDGCILWGNRVIIPPPGRDRVLKALHDSHPGMARMKSFARAFAWWPNMDKDIESMVRQCGNCQQNQALPAKEPLHPWSWPNRPWSRLHIDYAGPFMGKMFLIVVDAYSKWLEVIPVSSATSTATIEKLRHVFATHGLPDKVISDNGTCFTSAEFADFMKKNGIRHSTTAPYHPASNGLAERAVRTFKEAMKRADSGSIEAKVSRFLFRYRNTPHSTTGQSPAELLLGRKMKTHLEILRPDIASRVNDHQERQKQEHDRHAQHRPFCVGEEVYVKNFAANNPKWLRGKIIEQAGPVSFKVEFEDGQIRNRHADHIRKRDSPAAVTMQKHTNVDIDNDIDIDDCGSSLATAAGPPELPPPRRAPDQPQKPEQTPAPAPKSYPARERKPPQRYGVVVEH